MNMVCEGGGTGRRARLRCVWFILGGSSPLPRTRTNPRNVDEKLMLRGFFFFEADLEDSAEVYADPGLLEVVWTNLLSNAVKFTPEGGTVTLHQRTEPGRVLISVEDTGCGMTTETMRHIYDKFYQGDSSRATHGNGLGLALVRRFLEKTDDAPENGAITRCASGAKSSGASALDEMRCRPGRVRDLRRAQFLHHRVQSGTGRIPGADRTGDHRDGFHADAAASFALQLRHRVGRRYGEPDPYPAWRR